MNARPMTKAASLFLLTLAYAALVPAMPPDRAIQKEVVVAAPIDAVWTAWTTSEGIATFFAPEAVVEAKPDGAFFIHINPYAPLGLKGADSMRVLAVQEKKLLSFTWNAPPHLAEARAQRTVVVLRFEPVDEKQTTVRLTHAGWGDGGQWDQAYQYFDRAWGGVLAALQKRFVEGPRDWKEWRERMKAFQEEEDRKKAAK
jgi:uncharacterized protein YndB with AHSA1/START domain